MVAGSYEFLVNGWVGPMDGMIHEAVAEYGLPFTTSVEVFYLFNEGRLLDVGIRKTTDGP